MDYVVLFPPTHAATHTACSHPMLAFCSILKIFFYSYVLEYFVLVHMHTY